MITRFANYGFKDQWRVCALSGLDLFTSDNVNGVGKSAVLEGFKLALLGELPGRAKTVEDILEFTSRPSMRLEVTARGRDGEVTAEREFRRRAVKGEKRPVRINGVLHRFEEGHQWIMDHLGAVAVCFDPHEFLNLSDGRKLQWILDHSPESRELSRAAVQAALAAEILQRHYGAGLARSLLRRHGIAQAEALLGGVDGAPDGAAAAAAAADLLEELLRQDADFGVRARLLLDEALAVWADGAPAEENIENMLALLKAEQAQLQAVAKDPPEPPPVEESSLADLTREEETLRAQNTAAGQRAEALRRENEQTLRRLARRQELDARIAALRAALAGSARDLAAESAAQMEAEIQALQRRLAPLDALRKDVETCAAQAREAAGIAHDEGKQCRIWTEELETRRRQLATLAAPDFRCPVAPDICCHTDMRPHREAFAAAAGELAGDLAAAHERATAARAEAQEAGAILRAAQDALQRAERHNDELTAEIGRRRERAAEAEKRQAHSRGMAAARRRELDGCLRERDAIGAGEPLAEAAAAQLEAEKEKERIAMRLLAVARECGRRESLAAAQARQTAARERLELVKLLQTALGPRGIQGALAARAAEALETEVNACLRLIHSGLEFALRIEDKKVALGWRRGGLLIPFTTINSAHFILFIAPFLVAIGNRLARARAKAGLPTLRALCIEAEAMSPDNLRLLLAGLAAMRSQGFLDNVLVAHYHSLRDAAKLSGFTEHLLEHAPLPVRGGDERLERRAAPVEA